MKISLTNDIRRGAAPGAVSEGARGSAHWAAGPSRTFDNGPLASLKRCSREAAVAPAQAGFTMMEIAISLAVIGIALVAIIGVLPIGMSTQQDNRQETIIDQDASVLMEAVRNGSLGMDDLTNYVFCISNSWATYAPVSSGGAQGGSGVNVYTYSTASVASGYQPLLGTQAAQEYFLTNAANIIGLLSTPQFTSSNGAPLTTIFNGGFSNHIVACVYSLSGPVIEKPPQDNPILRQDSFSYRIYCVNASILNTNDYLSGNFSAYDQAMTANLHELRMTFMWPQLGNGDVGSGRQTFRALVAGQLQVQPNLSPFSSSSISIWYNPIFYYYQPQNFTSAP